MGHARTNRWSWAAVWLSLLALGAVPALEAQEPERYTFSDDDVAVYNLAGEVRVEAGTGEAVVVELVRGGADAAELRIETGRVDGRRALRVRYPGDRIVYPALGRGSRTSVRVREDGTFFDDGGDWFGALIGDGRVTIAGSGRGVEAYADIRVQVPEGRRIAVYVGAGKAFVRNVNGRVEVRTGSGDVEAAGTRGWLRLDTGAGRVSVRAAGGEVELDTGSGSVAVYGVQGSRLFVDTGSGSVDGGDVAVDDLDVDTGSGSIELTRVRADDIRLDTGSGSVELGLLADVNSLDIDTGSGGVMLTVPASLSARLELDTGSGGIDVDLPLQVTQRERDRLVARAGDGAGSIRVDTGSGGIRIRGS